MPDEQYLAEAMEEEAERQPPEPDDDGEDVFGHQDMGMDTDPWKTAPRHGGTRRPQRRTTKSQHPKNTSKSRGWSWPPCVDG